MLFHIHKMKAVARETFRWSPHTGGEAVVKQKDYEPGGDIEALSEYAAWKILSAGADPLLPGDLLEATAGEPEISALRIVKYIGFEPACWWAAPAKIPSNDNNQLNSVSDFTELPGSV